VQSLPQHLDGRVGLEGGPARQQLVEQHAQRIDIGGRPQVADLAGRLFGAHVPRGAEHHTRLRLIMRTVAELGEAEVRKFRNCRFQIADFKLRRQPSILLVDLRYVIYNLQ
jgi:hypothetical protein